MHNWQHGVGAIKPKPAISGDSDLRRNKHQHPAHCLFVIRLNYNVYSVECDSIKLTVVVFTVVLFVIWMKYNSNTKKITKQRIDLR